MKTDPKIHSFQGGEAPITMTMRNTLRLLVGLIAAMFIGYEAVYPPVLHAQEALPRVIAWSADSTRLATNVEDGVIIVQDGQIASRCLIDGTVSAVSFSSDGATLLVGTLEGHLVACDPKLAGSNAPILEKAVPSDWPVKEFKFGASPYGNRFFVSTGTQSPGPLYLYARSLTSLRKGSPMGLGLPAPMFLSDNTLLTFSRDGNTLTVNREGREPVQVALPDDLVEPLEVTIDGRYLFTTMNGDALVFDLTTGALVSMAENVESLEVVAGYLSVDRDDGLFITNIATSEQLTPWRERIYPNLSVYHEATLSVYDIPSLLVRDTRTAALTLFLFQVNKAIPLANMVDASRYEQLEFALFSNLLIVGVLPDSTEVTAYPIRFGSVPRTQTIPQRLSEPLRTVSAHTFARFETGLLMVFDVDTGDILYRHELGVVSILAPRPDGEAYAFLQDNLLIIQHLNGMPQSIALNN